MIGADTTVVVDDEILGKPVDDDDARAMLRRLSGRDHQVMTGVSLRTPAAEIGGVEKTTVWFSPLAATAIDWYVATGDGRDKAGAYAIQGLASRFIPRIDRLVLECRWATGSDRGRPFTGTFAVVSRKP